MPPAWKAWPTVFPPLVPGRSSSPRCIIAPVLIDILCKVVDNYGDIGVAYRLARAFSALPDAPRIRLIVDELSAFAALEPRVDPTAERQVVRGWEVFGWELSPAALEAFSARPTRVLVQCFACPRPDWLEALLFDPQAGESLIVDLEYLTAEDYAEDLHGMPSLTRSAKVRKAMFLPGFAKGTGGLIIDPPFESSRELAASEGGRVFLRRELLASPGTVPTAAAPGTVPGSAFWLLVFSYERDYSRIVADMAAFAGGRLMSEGRELLALSAAGRSQACFRAAWDAAGRPFPLIELPFLPQEAWDRVLLACDFSIVRGEDSWARAALSGKPFLWQAYPQEGKHHVVKVEAFLDRLKPHFPEAEFAPLAAAYRAFNDRDADSPEASGDESILPLLEGSPSSEKGFRDFADSVRGLGNLAEGLAAMLKAR